ncbi:uncharacterized protein LOC119569026 [Penaeus monodon]|uniref:uncharacterized protein LOC119569026 n=1 Tax=Penaeus monodon TaxID=6687 RepID=UPI0018A7617B|nr:uncharacterized protein LOC119569026 [Penaeus monodon]
MCSSTVRLNTRTSSSYTIKVENILSPRVARASCPDLAGLTGVSATPLAGGWAALTCEPVTSLVLPFNEHVVLSQCARGEWTVPEATCDVSVLAMFSSCPDPTPQPEMAAVNKSFASMAGEQVAAVYACQPGYAWLSGQDFAVTQCLNGNWTPIMDMCDTVAFTDVSTILHPCLSSQRAQCQGTAQTSAWLGFNSFGDIQDNAFRESYVRF